MSAPQQLLVASASTGANLTNHSILGADSRAGGATSTGTATFTLNTSGAAQYTTVGNNSVPTQGTGSYAGEWMINPPSSQYEARATVTLGSLSSGTTGTWLALSSSRSWTCTTTIGGGGGDSSQLCTLTVEIRDAATLQVLDSATISLDAEANSTP